MPRVERRGALLEAHEGDGRARGGRLLLVGRRGGRCRGGCRGGGCRGGGARRGGLGFELGERGVLPRATSGGVVRLWRGVSRARVAVRVGEEALEARGRVARGSWCGWGCESGGAGVLGGRGVRGAEAGGAGGAGEREEVGAAAQGAGFACVGWRRGGGHCCATRRWRGGGGGERALVGGAGGWVYCGSAGGGCRGAAGAGRGREAVLPSSSSFQQVPPPSRLGSSSSSPSSSPSPTTSTPWPPSSPRSSGPSAGPSTSPTSLAPHLHRSPRRPPLSPPSLSPRHHPPPQRLTHPTTHCSQLRDRARAQRRLPHHQRPRARPGLLPLGRGQPAPLPRQDPHGRQLARHRLDHRAQGVRGHAHPLCRRDRALARPLGQVAPGRPPKDRRPARVLAAPRQGQGAQQPHPEQL